VAEDCSNVSPSERKKHYEVLEERLAEMLRLFEGRVPERDIVIAREFLDVGEYGVALEQLTYALTEHGAVALRTSERAELLDLAQKLGSKGAVEQIGDCPPRRDEH
jgi:hypothetical protein